MFAIILSACVMTYSGGWPVHDRCLKSEWLEYRYISETNCRRAAHREKHRLEDMLEAEHKVAFVTATCWWVGNN